MSDDSPKLYQLPNDLPKLTPTELNRIIPLSEASELSSLSEDTLCREHADKIIDLSPRRRGMRVGHALMLDRPKKSA